MPIGRLRMKTTRAPSRGRASRRCRWRPPSARSGRRRSARRPPGRARRRAPSGAPGSWTRRTGSHAFHPGAPVVNTATRAPAGSGSAGSALSAKAARRTVASAAPSAASTQIGAQRGGTPRTARVGPAPRTQTVRSTSTGGMHAPDPSKISAAGSSDAASAAPAGTFDSNGAPASRRPRSGTRPSVHPRARRPRGSRRPRATPPRRSPAALRATGVGCRHARLGRPTPAHAHDHRVRAPVAQQRRPVAGHRGLARALAGADHGQLRPVERHGLVVRRVEPQARASRTQPEVSASAASSQLRARPAAPARRPGRPRRRRAGASLRSAASGSVSTGMP